MSSGPNGRIERPYSGDNYLVTRDLDNPHSEAVSGESYPEHILTFQAISIYVAPSELSFRLNYAFLTKSDYIFYEIKYDDTLDWLTPEVHVDAFKTSQGGNFFTNDWVEISSNIASGKTNVQFRLVIYQNGNDYIGLDDFQL